MAADLNGKVVIVTGASRGIGRQLAYALALRGARVVIAARTVEARKRLPGTIGETLAHIEEAGGTAIAVQCDVTVPDHLHELIATAIETFGRLDVLVNNAADTTGSAGPFEEYSLDSWRHQYDANVHAPFILMRLAVPHFRAQGRGMIVNVTSGAGDLTTSDLTTAETPDALGPLLGYASTKAALNRLSNALAPELARDNIAIVCVDPGFTRTELTDILEEKGLVNTATAHPMSVPVQTIIDILTADDPLAHTGRIIRSAP